MGLDVLRTKDVDPSQMERLLIPFETERVPMDEFITHLAMVSFVGGAMRVGIEVQSDSDELVKLVNPASKKSAVEISSLTIRDCTSEYASDLIANDRNIINPCAVIIGADYEGGYMIVATPDSNSANPIDINFETGTVEGRRHVRATLRNGEIDTLKFSFREDIDEFSFREKTVRFTRKDGGKFRMESYLITKNPFAESANRLLERINRYKEFKTSSHNFPLQPPPDELIEGERNLIRYSISEIVAFLGVQIDGEGVTALMENIDSQPAEDIFREIMERARITEVDNILHTLQEGIDQSKKHGFKAEFSITDDELRVLSTENFGSTTHLVSRWAEVSRQFAQTKSKEWLDLIDELGEHIIFR